MTDGIEPAEAVVNLDQVDPEDFAKLIAEALDEQLAEIVDGP